MNFALRYFYHIDVLFLINVSLYLGVDLRVHLGIRNHEKPQTADVCLVGGRQTSVKGDSM